MSEVSLSLKTYISASFFAICFLICLFVCLLSLFVDLYLICTDFRPIVYLKVIVQSDGKVMVQSDGHIIMLICACTKRECLIRLTDK